MCGRRIAGLPRGVHADLLRLLQVGVQLLPVHRGDAEAGEHPHERLAVAGAEGEEADEVDAAAENLKVEADVVHHAGQVAVAAVLVEVGHDHVEQAVEAGREREDHVGHGGDQDGDGQLPFPLAPDLLVAGGPRHRHVVTAESAHRQAVEDDLQHQSHVGHHHLHPQADGVAHVLVARVQLCRAGATRQGPCPLVTVHVHPHLSR